MTTTKTTLPALSPATLKELQEYLHAAVKATSVVAEITPQKIAELRSHLDNAVNRPQMYGALSIQTTEAGFCAVYHAARPELEIAKTFLPMFGLVAVATVINVLMGLGDKACSS